MIVANKTMTDAISVIPSLLGVLLMYAFPQSQRQTNEPLMLAVCDPAGAQPASSMPAKIAAIAPIRFVCVPVIRSNPFLNVVTSGKM
jgi:hypothetical protein